MSYKVHVAYGFHVNCYHSYRGDTNDKQGFGSDIRIIRKIISTLNEFNEQGIPVKGTWDFENAYSIEDILPEYAPDILENIKVRCEKYGDENIIMGYNNGALSAMNEEELSASINLAITNERGSGLKDVFGTYEPVVRPQEVMFTPSQVSTYNKLGIKALCLYYSCVPFDAFRTFIPQLTDEYAFNPVNYVYKGEKLTVMPTYNNSDIVDAGSLRYLCYDLHKQQSEGKINNDVLVFINMDADAIFWESLVPKALDFIPNADGIHGLVKEVADLDYVEFDTVGNYIKNHEPLCDIEFTEDTADGGYSGYASWSEKPFNSQIWTRLERARAYAKLYKKDSASPSFDDRIMLLSTTHFGLASPVLNVQREKKALEFSENAVNAELNSQKQGKEFTLKNISDSDLTSVQLKIEDGYLKRINEFEITGKNVKSFVADAIDFYESGCVKTVFAIIRFNSVNKTEKLKFSNTAKYRNKAKDFELKSESLRVKLCEHGNILSVKYKDRFIGSKNFLESYINYNGIKYRFENQSIEKLSLAGEGAGYTVKGKINLPTQIESGSYEFKFFTFKDADCVFIDTHIKYPYTKEETEISTESTALGRKSDVKWLEAVPFSITPIFNKDISVVKKNYEEDISSYEISDFGKFIPENKNLDSFNHHLTNGMIAVADSKTGMLIANAKQVMSSMAYCPMRLKTENERQTVTLNPFGTYYGKQRKYPTRSNGCAADAFTVVSPQSRSIAPSYNGVEQWMSLALVCYDGLYPDDKTMNFVNGFSEGSAAVDGNDKTVTSFKEDNVNFKAITENKVSDDELKSVIVSGGNANDIVNMGNILLKVAKTMAKAKIKGRKA